MDLMAYWQWKNYVRDLDEGAGFNFNSNQSRLHSVLELGDTLWLVTGRPVLGGMRYLVVASLKVGAKTLNAPDYKYGKYRVWGDFRYSTYFSADSPDASQLLRRLEFSSNQHITTDNIGQALQTMRGLMPNDTVLLAEWAKRLDLEPRAYQIADEATLEKSFEEGENTVRETVALYHVGVSTQKQQVLLHSYRRNRALAAELQDLYHGRCQLCGFDPPLLYNVRACQGHHVVYLSRGGNDALGNMMLLCPNHRREPLVLNKHLDNKNDEVP